MYFDSKYIQITQYLLKKIIGTSFPNPPVVSLIVESDKKYNNCKIINYGMTAYGGRPHAEAMALKGIKFNNEKKYILYSTLEPCCHEGRDEACVDKILKKKINRVVFSMIDPDKRVSGGGLNFLQKNGVEVIGNLLSNETKKIYKGYILNRKSSRPKVILKVACSLDNKISFKPNQRDNITNDFVKKIVHICRSECDAILVGANTVKVDNPKLNCRLRGLEKYSPLRVVLSKKLQIDFNSNIFKNCNKTPTLVFTLKSKQTDFMRLAELKKKKVKILFLQKADFTLNNILKELALQGVSNLLVEGGSKIYTSFLKEGLVDQIFLFRSNFFIGSQGLDIVSGDINIIKREYSIQSTSLIGNNTLEILERKNNFN